MRRMRIVAMIAAGLTCAVCFGEQVLVVADEAVVQEQSPRDPVRVGDVLRTATEQQGAAEKIYLKFDASGLDFQIADISGFEGYALRTKYPRGASVFLIIGDDSTDWSQSTITWDNAPGNQAGRALTDRGVKIGTFPPPGEKESQTVALEWESEGTRKQVVEALNSGNRCVTIAVIRPTTKNCQFSSLKNMDRSAHPFRMKVIPAGKIIG